MNFVKVRCWLGIAIAVFLSAPVFAQQSGATSAVGITRIVIAKRQVAFGGASFGTAGVRGAERDGLRRA